MSVITRDEVIDCLMQGPLTAQEVARRVRPKAFEIRPIERQVNRLLQAMDKEYLAFPKHPRAGETAPLWELC